MKWKGTDGAITVTVGPHYEKNSVTGISTSYYFFNGQRVAMRKNGAVYWIHSDHLGGTNIATDVNRNVIGGDMRYKPFGEPRNGGAMPTDLRFTGQRELGRVGQGMGSLMFYGARAYSPVLGRFVSADTIVPGAGNPQAFNRYSYVLNNPLRYDDPSGHACGQPAPHHIRRPPSVATMHPARHLVTTWAACAYAHKTHGHFHLIAHYRHCIDP